MKTEVRKVTPEVAEEMLKRNGNNRNLSKNHVEFLANEMKSNNWMFDGSPIRFSEGGVLLDGQHRLNAVLKSGIPQDFLIITGIDNKSFSVMDTGKTRSGGDILSVEGVKYSGQLAAAARLILNFSNGRYAIGGKQKISNTDVLNFYRDNQKRLDEFAKLSHKLYIEFDKVLPMSTILGFMFLFAERNITASEHFWNTLCAGMDLKSNSGIKHLRSRLIRDKIARTSLPSVEKYALIIKTWNAYRRGNDIKKLVHWRKGEKFPKII